MGQDQPVLGRGQAHQQFDVLQGIRDDWADDLVELLAFEDVGHLGRHIDDRVELGVDLQTLHVYDVQLLAWDKVVLHCLTKN